MGKCSFFLFCLFSFLFLPSVHTLFLFRSCFFLFKFSLDSQNQTIIYFEFLKRERACKTKKKVPKIKKWHQRSQTSSTTHSPCQESAKSECLPTISNNNNNQGKCNNKAQGTHDPTQSPAQAAFPRSPTRKAFPSRHPPPNNNFPRLRIKSTMPCPQWLSLEPWRPRGVQPSSRAHFTLPPITHLWLRMLESRVHR